MPSSPGSKRKLRVVFLHLDLGIGGAEQLVVNAALSAVRRGHEVALYTTHHDRSHCFAETKGDGVLARAVHVHFDWLPRQVLGRLTALCATVRMLALAAVVLYKEATSAQVLVCDGVSAPVPLLRLSLLPVVFYCHYPDKLLCVERANLFKRLYRLPLDALEEVTTGLATVIAVNSRFTAGIFQEAFTMLRHQRPPVVLYPPIDLGSFSARPPASEDGEPQLGPLVSINRFERKKGVKLAVEALAVEEDFAKVRLIIVGGYDARVRENVEYKRELEERVEELALAEHVEFRPNISDTDRSQLLREAACVLYTPDREHFGIVPVEAMYAGAPVIAVASGGPLETVLDGETGFLVEPTPDEFAGAVLKFVADPSLTLSMGAQGRAHVARRFSLTAFGAAFEGLLLDALALHSPERSVLLLAGAAAVFAILMGVGIRAVL